MTDEDLINKVAEWLGSGSINFFGSPFAGKDTQAALLSKQLNATIVAGGDILRSHSDQTKIKELMLTGELFPTDYYFSIVLPFLSKIELDNRPLIMSALGRWNGEEKTIMKAAEESDHPLKAVVFLHLSEPEIWKRFEQSQQSGDRGDRHDDAKHILEVRLKEFEQKTMPVIEAYRKLGILLEVDGHSDQTAVNNSILRALADFSTN